MTEATQSSDLQFMERALTIAQRGQGDTSPNPSVGCVIVENNSIVAEGWHKRAGAPHAEIEALKQWANRGQNATAYVTLEPCNHTGRTGPCTEALITAGISRVVVGAVDPNPRVQGTGIERLRNAGIEVTVGVLEGQCSELIEAFSTWVTEKRPLVTLKVATSLDGRIATASGHSQWVTGPESRLAVHRIRDLSDAILVGSGTVRADNPQLTTRLPEGDGRDPIRVVLSSKLDIPEAAHILTGGPRTIVATTTESSRAAELRQRGVEVWPVGSDTYGVALPSLLEQLANEGVTSLLVEGGRQTATAFLRHQLVDRVLCFVAPKIIGGDGIGWTEELAFNEMRDTISLTRVRVRTLGDDVCIEGHCVYRNN